MSADDLLRKKVLEHQATLEGICGELRTNKLVTMEGSIRITNESVVELRDGIDTIFEFFKSERKKTDELGFIKDTQVLYKKLDDGMNELNEALIAWGASMKSGLSLTDDFQAQSFILSHLRSCRTLLEDALTFFQVPKENP